MSARSENLRKPLADFSKEEIEQLDWYYVVELRPGCFTKGRRYPNILPTWNILQRLDLRGLDVLDIGVMEGLFSVLAARAGARVTSYDRIDFSDRIALVKEAYRVDFDYRAGAPFHEFARSVGRTFDVIIFAGVLYHTIAPTLFLYMVRRLLKPGGLMVLESAAAVSEDAALYFNEEGRFFKFTNYYQASTAWLDYVLRLLGFRILDLEYISCVGDFDGKQISRTALICELVGESVLRESDEWGKRNFVYRELAEYAPLPQSERVNLSERVRPEVYADELYRDTPVRSLNVTRVLRQKWETKRDQTKAELRLGDQLTGTRTLEWQEPKRRDRRGRHKRPLSRIRRALERRLSLS